MSIAVVFPYKSLSSLSAQGTPSLKDACSVSDYHPIFPSCFFPFGMYYIVPLLIIVLCYSRILSHMKRSSKMVHRNRVSLVSRKSIPTNRRHTTRTLFSLTCAFAICWLPIHVLELLNCRHMLDQLFVHYAPLLNLLRITALALSYFNSCLNPFLYAFFNKAFFL